MFCNLVSSHLGYLVVCFSLIYHLRLFSILINHELQSHAGLLNLCIVVLVAVNSRLIIENLMKV